MAVMAKRKRKPAFTADEVRSIREKAGLTQKAAAAYFHVSTRTWLGYELGECAIPGPAEVLLELIRSKQITVPRQ